MSAEILAGIVTAQAGAILALAAIVSRLRERLARLEEWVRVQERRNGRR